MNMPGFTAETSLVGASEGYHLVGAAITLAAGGKVSPQFVMPHCYCWPGGCSGSFCWPGGCYCLPTPHPPTVFQ